MTLNAATASWMMGPKAATELKSATGPEATTEPKITVVDTISAVVMAATTTVASAKPTVVPAKPTVLRIVDAKTADAVTEPVTPTTEPVTPTTEPVTPATEPVTPTTEPVTPTTEPVTPTIEYIPVPIDVYRGGPDATSDRFGLRVWSYIYPDNTQTWSRNPNYEAVNAVYETNDNSASLSAIIKTRTGGFNVRDEMTWAEKLNKVGGLARRLLYVDRVTKGLEGQSVYFDYYRGLLVKASGLFKDPGSTEKDGVWDHAENLAPVVGGISREMEADFFSDALEKEGADICRELRSLGVERLSFKWLLEFNNRVDEIPLVVDL